MAGPKRKRSLASEGFVVLGTYGNRDRATGVVEHREFRRPEDAGSFFADLKRQRVAWAELYRSKNGGRYSVDSCGPSGRSRPTIFQGGLPQ